MRILKVTQAYFPFQDRGGPATKVFSIANRLSARGHAVTILTADLGFGSNEINSVAAEKTNEGWLSSQDGVEAVYLNTWFHYRSLTVNPGVRSFSRRRLREFDLVHIYGLYDLLGPAVASACQRDNVPYIVEPMGMTQPIVRNIRFKRLYHRLIGSRMMSGASRFIATSLQEQEELKHAGLPKEKIMIRRNGVSVPEVWPEPGKFREKWNIPKSVKVILFLGRIVSKKAPDLLLKAFAAYRDGNEFAKDTMLVIAGPNGDSGYRSQLDSMILKSRLSKSVLFPGPLYDEHKWAAYRDADVFVLPSQNENFGNTVAEAVACGTPVVVTDRCGVAPSVDGRAGIVVPYDELALRNALTNLLHDDNFLEQLRQGCAEVTRELSWEEPMEKMESLYQNLLPPDRNLTSSSSPVCCR